VPNIVVLLQVMDQDHDSRVSTTELQSVLNSSQEGQKKMNSTIFKNLVEKSEKVGLSLVSIWDKSARMGKILNRVTHSYLIHYGKFIRS
jgi:hypothetical protein